MMRTTAWMRCAVMVLGLGLGATGLRAEGETFWTQAKARAEQAGQPAWKDDGLWRDSMRHSLGFFEDGSPGAGTLWDEATGSYATRVSIDGRVTDPGRDLIATSRMIYGLAHGSEVDGRYLERARRQKDFLVGWFLKRDEHGTFFLSSVDPRQPRGPVEDPVKVGPDGARIVREPRKLVVNEQAYGLSGLVALHAKSHVPVHLAATTEIHTDFVRRFHDAEQGGFFDELVRDGDAAAIDGRPTVSMGPGPEVRIATKSYNSTVYVATSYLLELAEVDAERRIEYLALLTELGDHVAADFPDPSTGWIVENFDRSWKADWRGWQDQRAGDGATIGVVGHNFQAAWLLNRLALFPGVDEARRERYAEVARTLLTNMLGKPVHDAELGGVYDVFQRETDRNQWHTNKPWWQQAEAILALTLASRSGILRDARATPVRDRAISFYFEHFVDHMRGGEYDNVDRAGEPLPDPDHPGQWRTVKAHAGKSTYHTVELARYMRLYAGTSEGNH